MIVKDYEFGKENNIKTSAIDACIKAFKDRFVGHVEKQGKIYLLDGEACEMILQIIRERELRFVSYELQDKERKLSKERQELFFKSNDISLRQMEISHKIIELERELRSLEKENFELQAKQKENDEKLNKVLPQRIDEFQKEAYNKYVFVEIPGLEEDKV